MSGCVVTCVNDRFFHYIPLWAYCIFRAYPDYSVKVFLSDPMTPMLREALKPLWDLSDLEVVEGEFKRYEAQPPRFPAWLRFLLFTQDRYHYWREYDWVYITDADLMIVREDPPLHEQHLAHMKATGLLYSNVLRDPLRFVDKHMTGLHFCGQEFIRAVMDKCTEYDGLFRVQGGGVLDGKPIIYDERLLYQIVRDSGLMLPAYMLDDDLEAEDPACYRNQAFRPWHGINIGAAMVPGWSDNFRRRRIPHYQETARRFGELGRDPAFWTCFGYLIPNVRRALRNMVEIAGQEIKTV